jgi:hypothetical protein
MQPAHKGKGIFKKKLRKSLSSIVVEDFVFQRLENEFKKNEKYDLFKKIVKDTSKKTHINNFELFVEIEKLNRIYNQKIENLKKFDLKKSIINRPNVETYKNKINKKLFEINLILLKEKLDEDIIYDITKEGLIKKYEDLEYRFDYLKKKLKKEIPDKRAYISILVDIKKNNFFYELNKYFYEHPNEINEKMTKIQDNQDTFMIAYENYFKQLNQKIELKDNNPEHIYFSKN